ncbi:MAG TPA: PIN domain-containing protein [Parapedobacter sp.]|uniref:PIN domain-containing protein n=1 Tax=Parapedobacter sp. TaxID=1958893 RepID=UPI002C590357|nr:PIN domain-containing protein [Parapedobacter sp.]HWK55743.1 PIN domain-containing protein [Parapedobacter sp.]
MNDMLNVFLDTNILFGDPYLKTSNQILLKLREAEKINIFVSEVVLSELCELQKSRLFSIDKEIKSQYALLRQISEHKTNLKFSINPDHLTENLIDFYRRHLRNKVTIIPRNNDIFDKITDSAIKKEPPFFQNRNEFKDAMIWYCYAFYATKRSLKNCVFVSNNVRDFSISKESHILHPSLAGSWQVTWFRSLRDFANALDLAVVEDRHTKAQIEADLTVPKEYADFLLQKSWQSIVDYLKNEVDWAHNGIFSSDFRQHPGTKFLPKITNLRSIRVTDFNKSEEYGNTNIEATFEAVIDAELIEIKFDEDIEVRSQGEYERQITFEVNVVVDKHMMILDLSIPNINAQYETPF